MSISWAAHRTRLLLIMFAAVLAVAGVLALTSQGASARASGSHAFHWGGGPKPVIVLVGHSYGGAVITNAAVGDPKVKALVFVDAFIPDQGETLGGLLGSPPGAGSCVGGNPTDVFNLVPYPGAPPGDVDTYIKPSLVPGCFASGLPAPQAAVIAATQRPLAASTLQEASGAPAWKTIPSWAVIGTQDRVIPPANQTFMAKRAGAHITDVNAGHLSLISKPSVVTRVILEAVQATG